MKKDSILRGRKLADRGTKVEGEHPDDKALMNLVHTTIRRATIDIGERFHFNTAISALDELLNGIGKYNLREDDASARTLFEAFRVLIPVMAPFAPHLSEELWAALGFEHSVFDSHWPKTDEKWTKVESINIVIQVRGKVRGMIEVPAGAKEEEIKTEALAEPKIQKFLEGKEPKKIIYVPNKLVNIVV